MKRTLTLLAFVLLLGCGAGTGDETDDFNPFEPPPTTSGCSSMDDSANYKVTFASDWTAANFPVDYPAGPHFSELIGGLHNGSVSFWEPGGTSSNGIELMAETGLTSGLANEIAQQAAMGNAQLGTLSGSGLGAPPDSTTINFTVDGEYPLVTLVSMLAPSPDWFVGVNGLDLCDGNSWVDEVVVELFVYDAGTDNGVSYQSPNDDQSPHDSIARITGPPFNEGPDDTPRAVGTFTFELQP